MCRHLAYLGPPVPLREVLGTGRLDHPSGPDPAQPAHPEPPGPPPGRGAHPQRPAPVAPRPPSLYEQSWAPRMQRHGTVNADGFGIGWHPPGDPAAAPARYRRAVPIWADPDLPDLARCIHSGSVLAAVRDATPGTSPEASAAAPYRSGHRLFSHNGCVPHWTALPADLATAPGPAELLALEGRCDSALLWALVVRRLRDGEPMGRALAAVTRRTAAVRPGARVNLLMTDGRTVAATRSGDTLWYRVGGTEHPGAGKRGAEHSGTGGGTGSGTPGAGPGRSVLVASEPTDGSGAWHEVPEGSLLLATRSAIRITPLALAADAVAGEPTARTAPSGSAAPPAPPPSAERSRTA